MYLHNDRDLFEEVINETNSRTGIAQSIIEKDYYVTMILKLLAERSLNIISSSQSATNWECQLKTGTCRTSA